MKTPSCTPRLCGFNTQPPEGGWDFVCLYPVFEAFVSTHSRLKAAGEKKAKEMGVEKVSTHSRLKAAGTG